ncbi:MAG: multidrug effflux MFS transporter [Anaerolineae bacterium]|nr:multidrug effflux MFS transporter [Anaerolineae bacterium]
MSQAQQKHLGATGLVVLIALLSAFIPLSTDLYLPALPGMSAYFGVSADRINWTLTAFFICYAFGTLVWGPLSDHYGRKPVLIAGLGIYIVASAFCALTRSVNGLVFFRVFQAIGGSASGTVATAIVKDVYRGRKRESVLAIVQSMVVIAPAVAPVLGAFLLKILSWRGIFWTLMGIGALALGGTLLFEESIPQRTPGMLLHSLGRLGKVLQNRGFTILAILFSLAGIPTPAYVASSPYIYQNGFHLSEQVFSYYFSLNALGGIIGPMVYLWLSRRFHAEKIIQACFAVTATSGLLVCVLGNLQPWLFALCILPVALAGSCMRPPSANMMLEQQKGDTGAVSSLMSCMGLLMGSVGMQLISLPWGDRIIALGIITLGIAVLSLLAWPLVIRQVIRLPGPSTQNQP